MKYLNLCDKRRSNDRQLWIAGCSFAAGVGVSKVQRYGNLIADKLNLPVSYLAQGGTSIEWAADQILRSDIRENDIVIWGITGAGRLCFYDERFDILRHVTVWDDTWRLDDFIKKKLLVSEHMIYKAVTHIAQVENYLKKISGQWVLIDLPLSGEEHDLQMSEYLSKSKNSSKLFDNDHREFIDRGTDGIHPGPKHHQWYANNILEKYNSLYNNDIT